MSVKVCIKPSASTHPPNNGIGRVLHAQYTHLPKFGIELVDDPTRAEVVACHTQDFGLPMSCLHLHGAYWTGDPRSGTYHNWHHDANKHIVDAVRRALIVTVPSEWVAEPFRRDMRISSVVVPHGIDSEAWTPGHKVGDYILFAKNRPSDVCDPTPAWELAQRGYKVVTTFAPSDKPIPDTLSVTGELPESEMKEKIQNAYLYLATTKETFGIQTLEALSVGCPVVGFDWGGTRDLITQGVDGILVPPYDYDALQNAINTVHEHRSEMGEAARAKAQRYTWDRACEMYASVYARAKDGIARENSNVAIVVTSYNYGRYLDECLRSLLAQKVKPSEVVVVDDASTDDTSEVANGFAQRFGMEGIKYGVLTHTTNRGVAAARNNGVAGTESPFVTCLDADDRLHPLYTGAYRDAFLRDRGVGIVYSGLGIIRPDGRVIENAWPGVFDWEWQAEASVPPHTTIPTGAMFRRTLWERSGGYRQKYAPGEDAEFYTRGLSLGFTAVKVTESPLIEYRNHGEGAHHTRTYVAIDDDKPWMRDRLYPLGAPSERPPLVRSYSDPLVSIYIEDEIHDTEALQVTLDSIVGQTWREWEVVIEYPVGNAPVGLDRYPFVKHNTKNLGAVCVHVNTGDTLAPNYLETSIKLFVTQEGGSAMASCCGGQFNAAQLARLALLKQGEIEPLEASAQPVDEASVTNANVRPDWSRMEYTGKQVGAATFFGKPNSGRTYRAGNNALERFIDVHREDVELMASRGFRLIAMPKEAHVPTVAHPSVSSPTADTTLRTPVSGDFRLPETQTQPVHAASTQRTPSLEEELISPPIRPQRVQAPVRVERVPTNDTSMPDRFKRIEVPASVLGDLAGDAPSAPVEAPITVSVPFVAGEDDAQHDARVRAAIEAEKRRRANAE